MRKARILVRRAGPRSHSDRAVKTGICEIRAAELRLEEIDVSQNEKELEMMVAKSGQLGVPVVDIDSNIVIGFDKERIDELLKLS